MATFPISARLAAKTFNLGQTCSFNIATDQTEIPEFRAVFLSSEAVTADGEATSDNQTVTLPGGATAIGNALGVTVFGGDNALLSTVPSTTLDANVTVALDKTYILEVAAGEAVVKGSIVEVNAVGQAVAATTGTATGFLALEAAAGTGTATNPEYIVVLVNQITS